MAEECVDIILVLALLLAQQQFWLRVKKLIVRFLQLVTGVFLFGAFSILCASLLIRCIVDVAFTLVQHLLLSSSQEFLLLALSAQFLHIELHVACAVEWIFSYGGRLTQRCTGALCTPSVFTAHISSLNASSAACSADSSSNGLKRERAVSVCLSGGCVCVSLMVEQTRVVLHWRVHMNQSFSRHSCID